MKRISFPILLIGFLTGCGVNKSSFTAFKKYSPGQLGDDYTIFQNIVEAYHPSLYWYTPKNEMDGYFKAGKEQLKDSLTEREFRKVLSFVYSKVNCGHSSVRTSKKYARRPDSLRLLSFPLGLKLWRDTAVVSANLNRKDSVLTRGTVITAINSMPVERIRDTLFQYLPSDGYNLTHKYQTLSNGGSFGTLYTTVFGLSEKYKIEYRDSLGNISAVTIPVFNPMKDTNGRRLVAQFARLSKKERKKRLAENIKDFRIDSAVRTAYMTLNSFGNGSRIGSFLRSSFRKLKQNGTKNLVIDVRGNGGGNVGNSTLLTKYIAQKPFKLADSLYAVRKQSVYKKYIHKDLFNRLFITFLTRKKADGKYHFTYFEKHYFKPKKKNHFDGNVYILTGGNSFSATTLFTIIVKDQDNVFVTGEETGGGAYGNTAWLIPDVVLPNTGVRFRLPLFRLVINKDAEKTGEGIAPEIEVLPSADAIKKEVDFKMEKVKELIRKNG